MKDELLCDVFNLFSNFIRDMKLEMLEYMEFRPEDIRLSAPEFLIRLLKEYCQKEYLLLPEERHGDHFILYGIETQPNYDMSIVIFHKEYPLYKKSWMIKKLSLDPPVSVKKERWTETIINLGVLSDEYLPENIPKPLW